jgi:hypothetical protein
MVCQDGQTYEATVEAASLFDAADRAIAGRSAPSASESGAVNRADRQAEFL